MTHGQAVIRGPLWVPLHAVIWVSVWECSSAGVAYLGLQTPYLGCCCWPRRWIGPIIILHVYLVHCDAIATPMRTLIRHLVDVARRARCRPSDIESRAMYSQAVVKGKELFGELRSFRVRPSSS